MNTLYAKITEQGIRYCLRIPHVSNASPLLLARYALEHGFKRLQEEPCPAEDGWEVVYKEEENFIRQTWVKIEA